MQRARPPRICIVTVDPSGDAIGAALAQALARREVVELIGAGGPRMRKAGVELLAETVNLTAIGAAAWMAVYPRAWVRYRLLRWALTRRPPDLLVAVNSGGFNIPLAKALKARLGLKVLYYVPPRCWSRDWIVAPLLPVVDYVAAPFPWNVEGDDGSGRVRFVGHPASDLPTALPSAEELREALGLRLDRPTLALLPGSRRWELGMHLPLLANAARLLTERLPDLQLIVSRAPHLAANKFHRMLRRIGLDWACCVEGAAVALRAADAALVCMGTATLEAAVLGCPMVTLYRCTRLTSLQLLFWTPGTSYFALPNLIAGRRIVPELLQAEANPERLVSEVLPLLTDQQAKAQACESLAEVSRALGGPGAGDRAAQAVLDALCGTWKVSAPSGVAATTSR